MSSELLVSKIKSIFTILTVVGVAIIACCFFPQEKSVAGNDFAKYTHGMDCKMVAAADSMTGESISGCLLPVLGVPAPSISHLQCGHSVRLSLFAFLNDGSLRPMVHPRWDTSAAKIAAVDDHNVLTAVCDKGATGSVSINGFDKIHGGSDVPINVVVDNRPDALPGLGASASKIKYLTIAVESDDPGCRATLNLYAIATYESGASAIVDDVEWSSSNRDAIINKDGTADIDCEREDAAGSDWQFSVIAKKGGVTATRPMRISGRGWDGA